MKLKFFLPAFLFAGLVVIFFLGLFRDPTLVESPFIGKPAPEFNLPSLYDPAKRITKNDLLGQITLVNVWASWCPGCAREHDMLLRIAREGSVPILGFNWKDEATPAKKWLQQRGNPYMDVAVDRDNVTGIDWGVYGAPETFLLDAEGIIRYKLIGPMTPEIWDQEFVPRIRAAQDASNNSANNTAGDKS
jgi:cytochrome c biogenesis protein CcmG/thiol:disulfide interchange protein DsbE